MGRLVRFHIIGLILLGVLLVGCGLMAGPQRPVIPTPIPTAPPLSETLALSAETVVDPVSDVVPQVDPAIQGLLDLVSQQQLTAYVQTLENFYTRNSFSNAESETRGIGAARRWIFSEFERVGNGRIHVEFDDFDLTYAGFSAPQRNVVATLPGSGPGNGVIIIMAHYDNRPTEIADGFTRATGADDNASGVALLIESARVLSAYNWNQTIKFVAMAAEEQGTVGSRHFAQTAFLDNMNVLAAINYDAVGGRAGIPQYVRLFSPDLLTSPSGELARYYEYIGGLYLPTFPVLVYDALDREGRWGDHREFVNVGMPSIRIIESEEDPDLLNSNLDTWSLVDYNYLQHVVQLNVAVVANMAGAPATPPAPTIADMAEPGSFLLTWAVDPAVAGYAIAFRPLDSPSYPTFRFVKGLSAGNVALTNLEVGTTYAVSMTALDEYGRVGDFSPEVIIGPGTQVSMP
ncbi:MAG: M20/M25/M40 family metallo-hydrolase [Ardenticatenaceae bacterium]|nr:M20/M25/M40 family metallo-hydrolase [Ardenticatenaceae bacterium]